MQEASRKVQIISLHNCFVKVTSLIDWLHKKDGVTNEFQVDVIVLERYIPLNKQQEQLVARNKAQVNDAV